MKFPPVAFHELVDNASSLCNPCESRIAGGPPFDPRAAYTLHRLALVMSVASIDPDHHPPKPLDHENSSLRSVAARTS